ncbi:MAG TPA: hypothetical protein VHP37_19750 [Burkholderiales bacterium]|nr:hypothetical protein [Burkholderiales bacterium]
MKPHPVLLRAPRELQGGVRVVPGQSGAPAILQRGDEDFIEATLESLRTQSARAALAKDIASASERGTLKLFQPVQRQFHLAIVEAYCDTPGEPRVDPKRIESAGMVLRRVGERGGYEGWMRAGGKLMGWETIDAAAEADARHDPAPARRLALKAIGPVSLARELVAHASQQRGALSEEHVIPLFVAPPDVCEAAGRTLYYGIVPTSSNERAEAPSEGPRNFGPDTKAFRDHLVGMLNGDAMTFDQAGETVSPAMRTTADIPAGASGHVASLTMLVRMLQQLAIEFDAFGTSPASTALFNELQRIELPLVDRGGRRRSPVKAGTFLKACVAPLLERDGKATAPEMPRSWPSRGSRDVGQLAQKLSAAMNERYKSVQASSGRFDRAGARYVLRAFVRIKPECGCPERTEWSAYTRPFTIAPWYEGAGAPAVQVPLPDPSDRALLKSLKPNVAFVVPASLNNLFSQDAKKLAGGEGQEPSASPALQWICGFSIPIITICAFIVLMIFLMLFDLIFRWLLFIKICIPFPKIGGGDNP